jgi:hypothetical protein
MGGMPWVGVRKHMLDQLSDRDSEDVCFSIDDWSTDATVRSNCPEALWNAALTWVMRTVCPSRSQQPPLLLTRHVAAQEEWCRQFLTIEMSSTS